MILGLSVIWLLIIALQEGRIDGNAQFNPIMGLWIIALPMLDLTAVTFRRLSKGQSPFHSDRYHLHHILLRAGFTPRQTTLLIAFITFALSSLGYIAFKFALPDVVLLALFIVLLLAYQLMFKSAWRLMKYLKRSKRKQQLN